MAITLIYFTMIYIHLALILHLTIIYLIFFISMNEQKNNTYHFSTVYDSSLIKYLNGNLFNIQKMYVRIILTFQWTKYLYECSLWHNILLSFILTCAAVRGSFELLCHRVKRLIIHSFFQIMSQMLHHTKHFCIFFTVKICLVVYQIWHLEL